MNLLVVVVEDFCYLLHGAMYLLISFLPESTNKKQWPSNFIERLHLRAGCDPARNSTGNNNERHLIGTKPLHEVIPDLLSDWAVEEDVVCGGDSRPIERLSNWGRCGLWPLPIGDDRNRRKPMASKNVEGKNPYSEATHGPQGPNSRLWKQGRKRNMRVLYLHVKTPIFNSK